MTAARARLAEVLGGPALARLRARLRARLERGAPLTGRLALTAATNAERSAVERLFGRMQSGSAVHVDLDQLATLLRRAELCDDLATAIELLEGPVANRRLREAELAERWRVVIDDARRALGSGSRWTSWLDDVVATGLLRRLAGSDPEDGAALLAAALAVLSRLPAPVAIPIAELAATAVGDSHALDAGEPLAALIMRALAPHAGVLQPLDVDQRRSAWAAVGVLVDELSAPVLVLNLRALATNPTGRALVLAADAGEPYRVSTRQLLRMAPVFALEPGTTVYVCENPSVVAAVADRLGPAGRPLVCTDGQPKTALKLLLVRLREAGAALAYHGDFDWPGIQIANAIVARFGARAWRLAAADYLAAPAGAALAGATVAPAWDAELGDAMVRRGCAVHEEAVLGGLLEDLDGRAVL